MNINSPILQQIAQYLCETIQREIMHAGYKHKGHYATGEMYNSIRAVVDPNLFGVSIDVEAAEQVKYVLSGRKKEEKGVPIDALVEWIRQRKLDLDGKKEQSVAFAIQRSIKDKGIKPSRFIDKSIDKFDKSKKLEHNIERFMKEWMDDVVKTISDQLKVK